MDDKYKLIQIVYLVTRRMGDVKVYIDKTTMTGKIDEESYKMYEWW